MNRRDFLRFACGLACLGTHWRLWAAADGGSGSRLVVVFLRGAYDALSVLVPYSEPFYYEQRPHIALLASKNGEGQARRLDHRWALHPALEDSLLPLYVEDQLAFVPFAGTEFVSRSHFQAQDWIEFGQGPGARAHSGFLNRLLEVLGARNKGLEGVSFTSDLPLIWRGPVPVANASVSGRGERALGASYESLLQTMYTGHAYEPLVAEGLGLRREITRELQDEMEKASRDALPAGGFALEAARIGRILRERPEYNLAFVDVGGWDTHAGQGTARGQLSSRLSALGAGLELLAESLEDGWQRTVVVVISEFGRTFRENGARGTDHGHGSVLWVLGGNVRGGRIAGDQAELRRPEDLHERRDMPVLNSYRSVLGGLFVRMFGLDTAALGSVFPGVAPRDLDLV